VDPGHTRLSCGGASADGIIGDNSEHRPTTGSLHDIQSHIALTFLSQITHPCCSSQLQDSLSQPPAVS
jgi:hypothetical protein